MSHIIIYLVFAFDKIHFQSWQFFLLEIDLMSYLYRIENKQSFENNTEYTKQTRRLRLSHFSLVNSPYIFPVGDSPELVCSVAAVLAIFHRSKARWLRLFIRVSWRIIYLNLCRKYLRRIFSQKSFSHLGKRGNWFLFFKITTKCDLFLNKLNKYRCL